MLADNTDEANGLATVFPYDAIRPGGDAAGLALGPERLRRLAPLPGRPRVRARHPDERPRRRPGRGRHRLRQGARPERHGPPLAHRGHGGAPRVRARAWTERQRPLRHVHPGHRARGRALPAVRGVEPAARLAAREHVVPARRSLPLLPPRTQRRRWAAGLPGRAGALGLALRGRRGGRGHPGRKGLPGALERVREGPARPVRGPDGRGPALAGHRARPGSPAAAPGSSTRAGRRTGPSWPTGTGGSTARRASGAPRREGLDLGLAAEIPANGTFALLSPTEAVVAVEDYYRYYWLWSDLWRVDLDTGRRTRLTEGKRATDPDVVPGGAFVVYVARMAPGEMALERLWLADGTDRDPVPPARRPDLPAAASPRTACASPSSSRWGRGGTSPSGRTGGWRA